MPRQEVLSNNKAKTKREREREREREKERERERERERKRERERERERERDRQKERERERERERQRQRQTETETDRERERERERDPPMQRLFYIRERLCDTNTGKIGHLPSYENILKCCRKRLENSISLVLSNSIEWKCCPWYGRGPVFPVQRKT